MDLYEGCMRVSEITEDQDPIWAAMVLERFILELTDGESVAMALSLAKKVFNDGSVDG